MHCGPKSSYLILYPLIKAFFSERGWSHRNAALIYIRKNYAHYNKPGVVYFADDDNSYDIRLFNNYIRKVKTIGFWAVGKNS